MKKLQKLKLNKLQDYNELSVEEQTKLKGGGNPYVAYSAQSYVGTAEVTGSGANPLITGWLGQTSNPYWESDETPWCSAFVNGMMAEEGITGTGSAAANSWSTWGTGTSAPSIGDVGVAGDGHHVGVVIGIDGDTVTVVAGNSGDAVSYETHNVNDWSWRTY